MVITYEILIKTVGFILSVSAVFALVWKIFKRIDKVLTTKEEIDKEIGTIKTEINNINAEQQIQCYGILACLDGLKQLGANGNVTKAHYDLEKYINEKAHS